MTRRGTQDRRYPGHACRVCANHDSGVAPAMFDPDQSIGQGAAPDWKTFETEADAGPNSKALSKHLQSVAISVLAEPSHYSAIERLRNGERLEIRALRPKDRDDLIAAVSRTSSESLYRRFFAVRRHFTETEQSFYLNIDFARHVALVALVDENGQPTIIGGGRYVVDEPGQAEVAFTVVDKYQRQGVGAMLLRHLAIIARQAGLRELVAYVLPDNRAMLKVFEKSGLKYSAKRESNSIKVRLGLL